MPFVKKHFASAMLFVSVCLLIDIYSRMKALSPPGELNLLFVTNGFERTKKQKQKNPNKTKFSHASRHFKN